MTTPEIVAEIIANLKVKQRSAMFTRDGQGSYTGHTFTQLLKIGLVDAEFRFTGLGREVRKALGVKGNDE